MPEVEPVLSAGPLLLIAAAAVGVLLFLIMKLKLHAFLALVLASAVSRLTSTSAMNACSLKRRIRVSRTSTAARAMSSSGTVP